MKPVHVLGISGSLRQNSFNSGLLRAAAEVLPQGMTLETFDLAPLPLYNQDLEGPHLPEAARRLRERLAAADAVLIATPEYNYSVTGVLKNALDWASRPLRAHALWDKPGAIMGAGGMYGTVRAQLHLRQIATELNMHLVNKPEVLVPRPWEKFDAHGNLTDEHVRQQVHDLLVALDAWTRRLRGDVPEAEPVRIAA